MTTASRSLFRFVQVRRLAPPTEASCSTAPGVVEAALDLRKAGSPAIRDAIAKDDRTKARALVTATHDRLTGELRAVGRLALAGTRRVALDERLTVGEARAGVRAAMARTGATDAQLRAAVEAATTLAVDLYLLGRWLRAATGGAQGSATETLPGLTALLRGLALLRLLLTKAEDGCRIRDLLAEQTLQLPRLPEPAEVPPADTKPSEAEARRLSQDAKRLQDWSRVVKPGVDPTLAELTPAAYPAFAGTAAELRKSATRMGIPETTTLSALSRALDSQAFPAAVPAPRQRITPGAMTVLPNARSLAPGTLVPDLKPGLPYDLDDMIKVDPIVPAMDAYARVLGRADLMIVRTEHLRYELGEISHIENVMASEIRERTHVVETETSETVTDSSRTLSESTQSLETTEHNSLERAAQTAASSESSMGLGVSVSGGFGPVRAGLSVDVGHSTSTSSSNSTAVSYSKDVTEQASETLRTEVGYERTVMSRTQVTETNLHRFENNGDSPRNLAGVYRWVDKVDQAQVYNYGERLLLEFYIPEPAAQLVAIRQAGEETAAPVAPLPFELEVQELNEDNYVRKAARWNAVGLEPPPAQEQWAAVTILDPAAHGFDYPRSSTENAQAEWGYASYGDRIAIPDGYQAERADVSVTFAMEHAELPEDFSTRHQAVQVAIGGRRIIVNDDDSDGVHEVDVKDAAAGPLPITVSSDQRGGLAVNVRVHCKRTAHACDSWKLRTYEIIRAAYLAQLDTYERDLRVQASRQPYAATSAPAVNRQVERTELKRGCQTILTGQDFDLYGALRLPAGEIPGVDVREAIAEGVHTQFFEDLFEWENMTYLFYPYQWAGRDRWVELLSRTSTDLVHQAFLQAGAARAVVPVREGYERVVGSYLSTSVVPEPSPRPWRGGGTSTYPPIDELIADANQRPGDETPIGEPWEVVTPTTLVYLQESADLNATA